MSDPNLTLHYNFAVDQSLAARIGPTLTITRATTATFFNSSGLIETAASGAARFEYDAVTRISKGLLVEEARTNICLQSEDFDTTWLKGGSPTITINTNIAPDGTLTADTLTDPADGFEQFNQSFTIASNSTFTLSLYVKKDSVAKTTRFPMFIVKRIGSTAADHRLGYDTSTGEVNAHVASGGGSVSSSVQDVGDYRRFSLTSIDAGSNTTLVVEIYPAIGNNTDLQTIDASITGSIVAWGAQLEAGAFPTSYIPTVASSVTRNADQITSTDLSWSTLGIGIFYTRASQPGVRTGSGQIIAPDEGGNNGIKMLASSGKGRFISNSDADLIGAATPYDTANQEVQTAAGYKVNDFELFVDGTRTGTGDQLGAAPGAFTRMSIGARTNAAADFFDGHIAEIRYYNDYEGGANGRQFLASLSNGIINEDSINLSSNLARPIVRKIARPY